MDEIRNQWEGKPQNPFKFMEIETTLLNDQWAIEDIRKEVKKSLDSKEN
jgi:hypothetical protein